MRINLLSEFVYFFYCIFLCHRVNKAFIGLAETDMAIYNSVSEEQRTKDDIRDNQGRQKFQNILDKTLSDYY